MKQFEAHGTTFFYGHEGVRAGTVSLQPIMPGGSMTVRQDALEAFCEQIPDGVVARLRVRAEAAEAAVGVADLEAEAAEVRSVESDVSFLRAELSTAQDRIKALEAHILRLESDARTAKRVREAIVADVLKALEPYRRV